MTQERKVNNVFFYKSDFWVKSMDTIINPELWEQFQYSLIKNCKLNLRHKVKESRCLKCLEILHNTLKFMNN